MLLHIKNMVCDRCLMVIRQQLECLGFNVREVMLGQVEITPEPDDQQLKMIALILRKLGFELIVSETEKTVEIIKNIIIELIHHSDLSEFHISFSAHISRRIGRDYGYLSKLFSNAQNMTIERFIIEQKIEKIKELLSYGDLNLNEISYQLGYSSSSHLSTQFKSVTGLTPSEFKNSGQNGRKGIDQI